MDTSNAPQFVVYEKIKQPNGIGGFIESENEVMTIRGYLDYLSGTEPTTFGAFQRESTHVLLTDYITGIKNNMVIYDVYGNQYQITLIDDPVTRHHHLEIYLRFVGDYNV